jgi:Family of unknown function (DUF5336)
MSQHNSMPDIKSLPRNDLIVLGSGILVFMVSLFFPWYGVKFKDAVAGFGGSDSTNAWHGLAAFGLILLLLALFVVAAQIFAAGALPELPVGYSMIAAGLSVLGALFVIIKSFDLPSASGFGVSVGLRWGGWLLIILVLVQAIFTVLRALSSGEAVPWQQHAATAGGPSVGAPPTAPPPTAPPVAQPPVAEPPISDPPATDPPAG